MARKNQKKSNSDRVTFHYIKSQGFVDLPVAGAYGGINTQTGSLWMALFSERTAIPQEEQVIPTPDGGGEVIDGTREGKRGVIRTVNAVAHMDINAAMSLHKWLGERIEIFKAEYPEMFEGPKKDV